MIKKSCGVLAASLLLGLVSCSDENPWADAGMETGCGAIVLELNADGSVKDAIPQTRGGSGYFETPGPEKFYVHLYKEGQLHTGLIHDEFVKKESFPTGAYTMKVFSGTLENEGYDVDPYFYGEKDLVVLEGRETTATVNATLGHTLITVTYTDNFKNYMKYYSSKIKSSEGNYVDVEENKESPAFLVPGEVSAWVNFTDPQGRELTLQPATFEALAAHHYQLRFDINGGEVAFPQLSISFLTDLEEETVTIDLTDDLYAAKAPEVTPVNFSDKEVLTFMEGVKPEKNYRFEVLSYGGLNSLKLTLTRTEGNGEPLPFSGEIELINASDAEKASVEAAGFLCRGVFRNPDKLAYVDFTDMAEKLPTGKYEVTVVATDMLTRASEPVSATIELKNPAISVVPEKANPATHEGTLVVTYNGGSTEGISFKAGNEYAMLVDAEVLMVENLGTKQFEDVNYRFTIRLPEFGSRIEEEVAVYLNGKLVETVYLPVVTSFDADAFAKKVMFKVMAPKNKIADITKNAVIEIKDAGGNVVTGLSENRNTSTGIITFSGLNPSAQYSFTVSGYEEGETVSGEFTTEQDRDVENGGFENIVKSIDINPINAGGMYRYTFLGSKDYQNTTSILTYEPQNWASITSMTCYANATNMNTWYCVPSTMTVNKNTDAIVTSASGSEERGVLIRSVAYDHNGGAIPLDDHGWNNKEKYSNQYPTSFANVAAGELFLGSFTFDGTQHRVNGIDFQSRPTSMTFEYKYVPVSGENGEAYIELKDSKGNTIASKSLTLADTNNEYKTATVELGSYAFGVKAAQLVLGFRSTKGSSVSAPVPSDRMDQTKTNAPGLGSQSGYTLDVNNYKSLCVGSKLTIDNVKLNY